MSNIITEQWPVMLYKVLRECTVEAFHCAIHLRTPRVGMVVANTQGDTGFVEVVGKLTPIVSLYLRYGKGRYFNELLEEVCCTC